MPRPAFLNKKQSVVQEFDKGAPSKVPQEKAASSALAKTASNVPEAPPTEQQPAKRKRQLRKDAPSMSMSARHFADIGDTYVDDGELTQ